MLTLGRRCRSHHFNCRFEDQRESEMPPEHKSKELELCTGRERLTKYEQEGLVPFVGKLNSHNDLKFQCLGEGTISCLISSDGCQKFR